MSLLKTGRGLLAMGMVLCSQLNVIAAEKPAWEDRALPDWKHTVSADAVTLEGGTEIHWKPLAFDYVAGKSVRYIDYDAGNDANTGQSPDQAWKHHPWDANATDKAKDAQGAQTYVFKRGVVYRGALVADDSGTEAEPVRLTSDPKWGQGEAILAGSEGIQGGWQKVSPADAQSAGFPDASAGKLWSIKLDGDYVPRALWIADAAGTLQRIPIARWPNWKAEHEYNIFTQWFRVEKVEKGFPRTDIFAPKVLNDPDPKAYDGATVWMDHANTSGEFSIIGPFPSSTGKYDPKSGRLQIAITHPRRHPNVNAPFFLENLPKFLDEAGEWYFSSKGDHARTLYVRLPNDADPNNTTIEVARHPVIVDLNANHVTISGLTFFGGNARDLNDAPRAGDWERPDNYTQMAAIRLNDSASHIRLHHLTIRDTAGAGVVYLNKQQGAVVNDIEVADSRFSNIDNEAIHFAFRSAPIKNPIASLNDIRILRNKLDEIGLRCSSDQGGRGIDFDGLSYGQIAGNVVNRTGGQGINVVGARMGADVPLVRILIDRNQVKDTLLQKQDFGGIEFWGVGPAYVFNNISINPVGWVAHRNLYHKNQAYYFDHGAKGYLFNNIGWSDKRSEAYRGILGDYFFHEIRNRWNEAFHNSALNFRSAMTHSSRNGDQQHYLANLFVNTYSGVSHWRLEDAAEIAFANNLFAGAFTNVYNRWKGDTFYTIDQFREHVKDQGNLLNAQFGWATDDMPIMDPEKHDFRLADNSAAIDRGVKVFVPWALYGTVGEWHFRLQPRDPNTVLAYDVYPQSFNVDHDTFRMETTVPANNLTGSGFTAAQYVAGVLEDWVPGAATFDGKQKFTLANDLLIKDFSIERDKKTLNVAGKDRKTVRMEENNFLIEAVVRVETKVTAGSIVSKLSPDAGYALLINPQGQPAIQLRAGQQDVILNGSVPINDGRWHHLIAEVDRTAGKITLYVNGAVANGSMTGTIPPQGASLDNRADFVVGENLTGAMDFLRICRGTLADAKTNIDELMAWQFNGPAQHDFVGRAPTGGVRDIGALEHPTVSGQQPIRYTPPAVTAQAPGEDKPANEFRKGPDRTVQTLDWGSVSVPKQAKIGEKIDVQVVFGTETIEKQQMLRVDMHGFVNGKRVPGIGRANPIKLTPGVTTPYNITMTVRPRDGMTGIAVVIYASPDGSYDKKILSTEASIDVVANTDAKPDANGADTIKGPSKTESFEWGSIQVPESVKVGEKLPVVVKFKDNSVKEKGDLRIDLHWWKGKERVGVLGAARHPNVSSGESVVKEFVVPDKEGLTAIAAIVYVAPGGDYSKRFISGTVGGISVKPAETAPDETDPAKPPADKHAEPAAQSKPDPAPSADNDATVVTKKTKWGTMTISKDPKVGDEFVVTITFEKGVITEPTVLTADLHWWKGRDRAGAIGKIGQKKISPDQTGPVVFKKSVPDKEGISAIAAVISLSPDGTWAKKTHSSEIGTSVMSK